jgi:hypothetical protein
MKVYQAMHAVLVDLAKEGIAKDSKNLFDNYQFRGIDAVYQALSQLLSKHGLLILPRITHKELVEREGQKGNALFYTTLTIEYDFICVEDGSRYTAVVMGEAMDRSDKSLNKAMTAAYKYLCFQAFSIPVQGSHDADSETLEVVHKPNHKPVAQDVYAAMNPEEQAQLQEIAATAQTFIFDGAVDDAVVMIDNLNLDADAKAGLWALFNSSERAALKKASSALRATS